MKTYRMEINSGSLPLLSLDFDMASHDMATSYAKRISLELASTKWNLFTLWDMATQDRIAEWTLTAGATATIDL